MSKYQAEQVKEHLEQAAVWAAPLKDGDLLKKIEIAKKHVGDKLDPQKG
jgi:hypothetical protein